MRPLILQGHTRPLTQVVYNREGDLIFSTAKDNHACVWYSSNGERLGTFGNETNKTAEQHRSTIWSIDVSLDSQHAITGSGDCMVKVWDVNTGKVQSSHTFGSSVRCVNFSLDCNLFCAVQDRQMKEYATVFVCDRREPGNRIAEWRLTNDQIMATRVAFGAMDKTVFTGDQNGYLKRFDWRNVEMDGEIGIPEAELHVHNNGKDNKKNKIQDMKLSKDRTMVVTSSKDKTSKLVDCVSDAGMQVLKEYRHRTQVNSAAFHPTKPHILLACGQEAMDVTQTSADHGQFETYIFNMISQDPICHFKGHFGPVNYLAIHPDAHQIVTGGEEGLIRINNMDQSYVNYQELDYASMSNNVDIPVM